MFLPNVHPGVTQIEFWLDGETLAAERRPVLAWRILDENDPTAEPVTYDEVAGNAVACLVYVEDGHPTRWVFPFDRSFTAVLDAEAHATHLLHTIEAAARARQARQHEALQ